MKSAVEIRAISDAAIERRMATQRQLAVKFCEGLSSKIEEAAEGGLSYLAVPKTVVSRNVAFDDFAKFFRDFGYEVDTNSRHYFMIRW